MVYLDNILIYIEGPGKPHIDAVWWVLEQLQKHDLYANLNKCQFHENEIWFLSSVVSAQEIMIEEKRIKIVKTEPKPQSVRDIQMFLGFASFYRRFMRNFSKIVALLTLMLQTTTDKALSTQATKNEKNYNVPSVTAKVDGGEVGRSIKNLSTVVKSTKSQRPKSTKSKKSDLLKAKVNSYGTDFLTLGAKKTFIYL